MAFKRLSNISLKNRIRNIIIHEYSEKNQMSFHYMRIRQLIGQSDSGTVADRCL